MIKTIPIYLEVDEDEGTARFVADGGGMITEDQARTALAVAIKNLDDEDMKGVGK